MLKSLGQIWVSVTMLETKSIIESNECYKSKKEIEILHKLENIILCFKTRLLIRAIWKYYYFLKNENEKKHQHFDLLSTLLMTSFPKYKDWLSSGLHELLYQKVKSTSTTSWF